MQKQNASTGRCGAQRGGKGDVRSGRLPPTEEFPVDTQQLLGDHRARTGQLDTVYMTPVALHHRVTMLTSYARLIKHRNVMLTRLNLLIVWNLS